MASPIGRRVSGTTHCIAMVSNGSSLRYCRDKGLPFRGMRRAGRRVMGDFRDLPTSNHHTMTLRPWADCPDAALTGLRGVLTDIDDTLTRDGVIESSALAALHRLAAASLPVIAVTGRPAGWSEPFALSWPVHAIVAENGAVMLRRHADASLAIEFADPLPLRLANAARLALCAQAVLAEVPGATLARDSAGRLTDIAIDHSEFAHLDAGDLRGVQIGRAHV